MFAFSQIDPETTGEITALPVDWEDSLVANAKAGWGGTLGKIYGYRQLVEEEADKDSPLLSAEEANKNYPTEKPWSEPVHENVAQFLHDRHVKNQQLGFYLQNDEKSIVRNLSGMGVGMISATLNPVDMALLFLPAVGKAPLLGPYEIEAVQAGALGVGARISERVSKGLVTDYRLEQIFGKMAGTVESSIQGAAYMTAIEPINQYVGMRMKEDAGNPLVNIAGGALMAGGMHAVFKSLGWLWARLSPETKHTAFVKAMDDFAKGKEIEIEHIVKADIAFAEEMVALKEHLANLAFNKAIEEANPHHVAIAKDLGLRYDGIQALIPGQWKAVYTFMDQKNPYTLYMDPAASRAEVKAALKAKIDANKPEPTFEQKIKQIFQERLDAFRKEMVPPREKPVVPETGVEVEREAFTSVLDEIRQKGLKTKEAIQQAFPKAELTREQAGALRRAAWGQEEVKKQHEENLADIVRKAQEQFKSGPSAKRKARDEAFENMPHLPQLENERKLPVVFMPDEQVISLIIKHQKTAEQRVIESIQQRFITAKSWAEFHPDVQSTMADVIALLSHEYPVLTEKTWSMDLKTLIGAVASVSISHEPLLKFNKDYYKKEHIKTLLSRVSTRYGKPGTYRAGAGSGYAATIVHELAHVISNLHDKFLQENLGLKGGDRTKPQYNHPKIQAAFEYIIAHPPKTKDLSEYGAEKPTGFGKGASVNRTMQEAWAEAFAEAYSGVYPPTEWQKGFNKALGVENRHSLVAKLRHIGLKPQPGKLGTQGFFTIKDDPRFVGFSLKVLDDSMHLNNIQVVEELRGKGIGSEMIKKLQNVSDLTNMPLTLTAEALSKHEPGKQARLEKYYERLGFERVKENEFVYKPREFGSTSIKPKVEKWTALEKEWEKYIKETNLTPTDWDRFARKVLDLIDDDKAPESLRNATTEFISQPYTTDRVMAWRKELNKHLYPESPMGTGGLSPEEAGIALGKVQDDIVKKLKAEGEKRIEELKKKLASENPNAELINAVTDCVYQTLI